MCLINIAFQSHPKFPIVLVANRDEFYDRPAQSIHWWKNNQNILAGLDEKEGGTWMGINRTGKFAVITNYRDPKKMMKDAPSRGEIVYQYLAGNKNENQFQTFLFNQGKNYNGFSLLFGDSESLHYYSNRNHTIQKLIPGIYGLSNANLNTPWPKLLNSKKKFEKIISNQELNNLDLLEIFQDKTISEIEKLPLTGVPIEIEQKLSAIFIEMPNYGTRVTTILKIDTTQNVSYFEKSYMPENTNCFEFKIQ